MPNTFSGPLDLSPLVRVTNHGYSETSDALGAGTGARMAGVFHVSTKRGGRCVFWGCVLCCGLLEHPWEGGAFLEELEVTECAVVPVSLTQFPAKQGPTFP